MVRTNILKPSGNRKITEQKGAFSVVEYLKDISVDPVNAQTNYFMAEMGFRRKQVVVELDNQGVIIQAGAMQWMSGSIDTKTNVKGVGDFAKKMLGSVVTKESAMKPLYFGTGELALEPTYKYIMLEDFSERAYGMVIEYGMLLACDESVKMNNVARKTLSSAALGNEGLFNTSLSGYGIVALESYVPRGELIELILDDPLDTVKIDGDMAIAWSKNLEFTVERTTKTLVGSAASGEGLVNVYRGRGKIWMAPLASYSSSVKLFGNTKNK
ncbi:MAG: AIM24 family protein [Clostridiales bacterium]|nr:AIM24 family protein [Clostridiales bacterium]